MRKIIEVLNKVADTIYNFFSDVFYFLDKIILSLIILMFIMLPSIIGFITGVAFYYGVYRLIKFLLITIGVL